MTALPLAGGQFWMGSDRHYPEERPRRPVTVAPFRIDRGPVTNAMFAAFVDATGYRTVAEQPPDPAHYPGADPATLVAGSIVFSPPAPGAALRAWGDWWRFVPGAHWRTPDGQQPHPGPDHPVVHVALADAAAYAAWAGKALPTEAEWEYAAWGGACGTEYAWGDELAPGGVHQANTWQGRFPYQNTLEDGHAGTSPVGRFPANRFGLLDMIGNVWEWTADRWQAGAGGSPCCAAGGGAEIPRHVIKGGSHLCAPNYCQRYRPAARQPQAVDSGTSHIGFRCVQRSAG